jgi:ketosteroid isomerase-like protein
MSNVRTVQEMYAAFGRGDVPAILSRLADSVEWEYGPVSTTVPWLQRRHGRDGAAGFFASLAEIELHRFAPKEFLEGDGVVVVLIDVEFTVRATGKRVAEEDEIHVWRFDPDGRVVRYRHGVDTHLHQLAWGGPSSG